MPTADAAPKKNYAILRFAKIRSWATLRLIDQHNNRKGEVSENVRQGAPEPVELHDDELGRDFVAGVTAKLDELGIPKQSAEGKILAVEAVTSASRAWFEAANEEEKQEWVRSNLDWARANFGRGMVSAKLHLDEETWHIHFIAVPAVEKAPKRRGRPPKDAAKLAARAEYNATRAKRWTLAYEDVLGGHRENLSREQDRYHAAVSHLGLARGEINPDIVEIHLGDELFKQIEEWERGAPRKNITPQEYRREIKRLRQEAEQDRKAAALSLKGADAAAERIRVQRQRLADRLRRSRRRARDAASRVERDAQFRADAIEMNAQRQSAAVDARSARLDARAADLDTVAAQLDAGRRTLEAENVALDWREQAIVRREAHAARAKADAEKAQADAAALRATAEADREALEQERAQAAIDDRRTARQIQLVGRAMHTDALLLARDDSDRGVSMNRPVMNANEREAYDGRWSDFAKGVGRIVADALAKMRERFNEKMRELADGLADLARQRDVHAAEVKSFEAEKLAFEKRQLEAIDRENKVVKFYQAWQRIPPEQRLPVVQDAVAKAGIVAQASAQRSSQRAPLKGPETEPGPPPMTRSARGGSDGRG